MATKRSVDINSDRLRKEFEKRGLSIKEVAETVGVTPSALSKNLTYKSMANTMVIALQRIFNINMDDIIVKEDKSAVDVEEKKEETVVNVVVNFEDFYNKHSEEIGNKLHQIIYSAVYEAVKKAWSE